MLNTKETLKKLHKRFPMMSLDELFEILDCYIEYYNDTTDWLDYKKYPKVWYSDKVTCQKDSLTTNENCLKYYDRNTITTAEPSSIQFTASH